MALQFFNTLTRRKEEFVPIKPPHVGMYTCGPTVYNYAHIGNFRAFVFQDLLRRYLEYKGFEVKHVMNITDVEDKIIRSRPRDRQVPEGSHGVLHARVLPRPRHAQYQTCPRDAARD